MRCWPLGPCLQGTLEPPCPLACGHLSVVPISALQKVRPPPQGTGWSKVQLPGASGAVDLGDFSSRKEQCSLGNALGLPTAVSADPPAPSPKPLTHHYCFVLLSCLCSEVERAISCPPFPTTHRWSGSCSRFSLGLRETDKCPGWLPPESSPTQDPSLQCWVF